MRPNSDGPSGKAGEIVAALEHRLITGYYRFGDSLSTNLLAGDFEASRQPISAALNHLRGLGYLKIVPQVGCQVVSPSPQDIDDFFSMLAKIESLIAGLAASRFVDNEADLLLEIAEHIKHTPFDDATHRDKNGRSGSMPTTGTSARWHAHRHWKAASRAYGGCPTSTCGRAPRT